MLNEDLVNLPNWLVLKLRIEGEDAIRLADVELLDYRHALDIRDAVVMRELRFRDRSAPRDDAATAAGSSAWPTSDQRGDRVDADRGELVWAGRGRLARSTGA